MYPEVKWLKQQSLSWVYEYKMKWSHRNFMLYVNKEAKRQMFIFMNKFCSENGCSAGSTTLGARVSSVTQSIED